MTGVETIDEYFSNGLEHLEPSQVIKAFLKTNPKEYLNKEDYDNLTSMPNEIEIFRGCDMEELDENGVPLGISWTLDYKVAEFFAYRFGNTNSCIVKAVISKDDIICFTNRRNEMEIVTMGVYDCEIISFEEGENYNAQTFHDYLKEKNV